MTFPTLSEFTPLEEYCARRRATEDQILERASKGKQRIAFNKQVSFYYWDKSGEKKVRKRFRHSYIYLAPQDIKKFLKADTTKIKIRKATPSEFGRNKNQDPPCYNFTKSSKSIPVKKEDLAVHRRNISAYKQAPAHDKLPTLETMIRFKKFNFELNIALEIYSFFWRLFIATNGAAAKAYDKNVTRLHKNLTFYDKQGINEPPNSSQLLKQLYKYTPQAELNKGRKSTSIPDEVIGDSVSSAPPTKELIKEYIKLNYPEVSVPSAAITRISYLSRPQFYKTAKIPEGYRKVAIAELKTIRPLTLTFLELPLPLRVALETFLDSKTVISETAVEVVERHIENKYNTSFAKLTSRTIAEAVKSKK